MIWILIIEIFTLSFYLLNDKIKTIAFIDLF